MSCKKNDTNRVLFFIKTTHQTPDSRNYNFSKLKIYFSGFRIYDHSGNPTLLKDVVLVKNTEDGFSFQFPNGNYHKLTFGFGLDSTLNSSDPTVFDATHPLSLEQDMYWGMIKYRFLVLEGSVDSSSSKTNSPNTPYSMHLGTDSIYQQITFIEQLIQGSNIEITLDLDQVFKHAADPYNPIDFSNQSTTSEIPKTIEISRNFVNGITIKQVIPN